MMPIPSQCVTVCTGKSHVLINKTSINGPASIAENNQTGSIKVDIYIGHVALNHHTRELNHQAWGMWLLKNRLNWFISHSNLLKQRGTIFMFKRFRSSLCQKHMQSTSPGTGTPSYDNPRFTVTKTLLKEKPVFSICVLYIVIPKNDRDRNLRQDAH